MLMVSCVQGDLPHPLYISPAKPAFEGWQAKPQVPTSSLGTSPASSAAEQGPALGTRVLSFPCPGGDQGGCQLPSLRAGHRRMMVCGLRGRAALAGFALEVLTWTTSPDRWKQPKSQIAESPDVIKLRLLHMRPGPDVTPAQKCQ